MDDLADKIRNIQKVMTNDDKTISFEPIYIEIYLKNEHEMTIIDLPGMTRAKRKDQVESQEEAIKQLYMQYMKPKETIIINVSSIAVDLDTSASLRLSQDIDVDGERTVLCLTKMDTYTDIGLKRKIQNILDDYKFDQNNIFMIRNRNQKEMEDMMDQQQIKKMETQLLNTMADLRGFPDHMKGIESLTNRIVDLQRERIEESIGEKYVQILERKESTQK